MSSRLSELVGELEKRSARTTTCLAAGADAALTRHQRQQEKKSSHQNDVPAVCPLCGDGSHPDGSEVGRVCAETTASSRTTPAAPGSRPYRYSPPGDGSQ